MDKLIINIWLNFSKELWSFIYRKTKSKSDADDILQTVFLKITTHIDKVSAARNMRQYIFAIVNNELVNHYQGKQKEKALAEFTISESEEENLNTTIAENCLKPFMKKLPEPYFEAIWLSEIKQISQKELAERLGISYSGAKSRVQRGRMMLKELILNCCAYEWDKYGNLMEPSCSAKKC